MHDDRAEDVTATPLEVALWRPKGSLQAVHLTPDADWGAAAAWCGGVHRPAEGLVSVPVTTGPSDAFAGDWIIRRVAGDCAILDPAGLGWNYEPAEAVSGDLRFRIDAALDESADACARCKICDVQVDAVMAIAGPLAARLGELESAISWQATCLSCSATLDSSIHDHERAELAEGRLAIAEAALRRLAIGEPVAAGGADEAYARRLHAARALLDSSRLAGAPEAPGSPVPLPDAEPPASLFRAALGLLEAADGLISVADADSLRLGGAWECDLLAWRDRHRDLVRRVAARRELEGFATPEIRARAAALGAESDTADALSRAASVTAGTAGDGVYARVTLVHCPAIEGWVADGHRAGMPVLVIRGRKGRLIAEVGPSEFSMLVPLDPRPCCGELMPGSRRDVEPGDRWAAEPDCGCGPGEICQVCRDDDEGPF